MRLKIDSVFVEGWGRCRDDLQLLAIVNRIWNDVIKQVAFDQESHSGANIVRNVVLLS